MWAWREPLKNEEILGRVEKGTGFDMAEKLFINRRNERKSSEKVSNYKGNQGEGKI